MLALLAPAVPEPPPPIVVLKSCAPGNAATSWLCVTSRISTTAPSRYSQDRESVLLRWSRKSRRRPFHFMPTALTEMSGSEEAALAGGPPTASAAAGVPGGLPPAIGRPVMGVGRGVGSTALTVVAPAAPDAPLPPSS